MTKRRRFTAEFKARVALDALRGDKTIQEIATKHKVHPNQVSTWKRQAMDGLGEVFSNGADHARRDHETEIHDLHATILHLLGLNHERLSYYHNGIERRLTDVHGEVIEAVLV